jgi:hypothetical protein
LGKITEITVSKGKTLQTSEKEWFKVEYSLKAQLDSEEEVNIAKASLEGLLNGWLSAIPTTVKPSTQEKPRKTLEAVQNAFPTELRELLAFTENSEAFIIRPRQFLGSENFAKIIAIAKHQLGGTYIRKGKESHFEVPK